MDPRARLAIGAVVSAWAVAIWCAACSGSPAAAQDHEHRAISTALVGGTASDGSQDEVVLVIHRSTSSEVSQVCSGTLLAPNLVLTARHCVASADPTSDCTSDGTSAIGGQVYGDYDANDLYVFAGVQRPSSGSLGAVSQRGSEILDDGSATLCNHDLALVLLATPVPDAKIAPVRLERTEAPAEPVTLVGWGITDETSAVPMTRQQRTGESVLAVGPGAGLGASELSIGEGPCEGDSGGPALAASGAVIGTLSRGGNGNEEGGAGACIGATSVYTALSGFKDLILSAYARAGQTPQLENGLASTQEKVEPATGGNGGCASAGPLRPQTAAVGWTLVAALAVALGASRRSRGLSSRARE